MTQEKEAEQRTQSPAETRTSSDIPVVGIGASAGGLEAFEGFFKSMIPDAGIAFVLVAHLDPTHVSILPELIQKRTGMKVSQVTDNMAVAADQVFIIPPNRQMVIFNNKLQLLEIDKPRGANLPIDTFFLSLAQDQGQMAIGIILSGTGSDGTRGIKAIKGEGGMVMAQDLNSAKYDGMPGSAIATGAVDFILAPEDMPDQLVNYIRNQAGIQTGVILGEDEKFNGALQKIYALLRASTGHDLSQYKKNTICRRIERRMNVHQIHDISRYIRYLQESDSELTILFKEMLIGVTSFFRDAEAYEALQKSRKKYIDLYDFATAGYLTVEPKGRIVRSNLTAAKMLEVERAHLIDQPLSHFIQYPDQDIYFRHRTALLESRERQSCELGMKTAGGRIFHAQMESTIQASGDNGNSFFWTILSDISKRKEAEEALLQAKKNLESRVRERTMDLQKTHSQLLHAEKLAAIGKLAASIAHEFNNPLQGLLSIIKGIKERVQFDEDDGQLIEMAVAECLRMRDLIRCLQDFNRPSSGEAAPLDLHGIIDAILLLGTNEFRKRKIRIEKDYAVALPLMIGVADQIKQVLLNLLNNAVDACEGGGVITVTTSAKQSEVIVDIKDNGMGIPLETQPSIFDPFFTTKAATKGTGLGLTVSSQIVQQHGGTITATSTPGKGAVFRVVLPVNETIAPGKNALY